MKNNPKYIRPELFGHKVLYKGLRYWVFEVDADFPFDGLEKYGELVLYDCLYLYAITSGKKGSDGVIRGSVQFGQSSIEVSGKSLEEFIDDAVATSLWVHKETGGE